MSTAATTQHRFPHQIALAAAATVVVVGGVTAIGIAASQDSTTTPTGTTSATHHWPGCTDPRCLPPDQRAHGQDKGHPGQFPSPAPGGQPQIGLP
ncbi:hypothetical protein [Nocardioides sp.]|jgi:hypothetical protein|uniref:hypothetical protein n=1 Tax=Nocardioides sp. TaxID=35761 RepID=UPI002F415708